MKLYHGGYNRIEHPDCLAGRDNLDFGKASLYVWRNGEVDSSQTSV